MMQKISLILVKGRYVILALTLAAVGVCIVLAQKGSAATDMTAFLPDDSSVKEGMTVMEEEFDMYSAGGTIRLMGRNMSAEKKSRLLETLADLKNVESVVYEDDNEEYNRGKYSLFVVNSDCRIATDEGRTLEKKIAEDICPRYNLVYDTDNIALQRRLPLPVAAAIFLFLLVLILLSPRLLQGTVPKVPRQKPDKWIVLYTKAQTVILFLLTVCWVAGTVFRDSIVTSYYMPKPSEINDVFPRMNKIAVLYDADEEEDLTEAVAKLEETAGVDSVRAYANTLGKRYAAREMAENITELAADLELQPWTANLVYFDRGSYETPPILLSEFISFWCKFTEENPGVLSEFGSEADEEWVNLAVFADKDELARPRTAAETAALFGIEGSLAKKIYQLSGKSRMSPAEFLKAAGSMGGAAASVTPELLAQIEMASLFADQREYTKERTTAELSQIFGVDQSVLSGLLMLRGKKSVSIKDLIEMISSNSFVLSMIPSELAARLDLVDILTDQEAMSQKRTAAEISELFDIDRALLSVMGDESMSIAELMQLARNMSAMPDMTSLTENDRLALIRRIMSDTENGKTYAPAELAELSDRTDEKTITLAYRIYYSQSVPVADTMTMEQFVAHIAAMSKKEEYAKLFDERMRASASKAAVKLAVEKRRFVGENHSVLTLFSRLPEESAEMDKLLEHIEKTLKKSLDGKYYLIGNASVRREAAKSFSEKFRLLSIITAAAYFAGFLVSCKRLRYLCTIKHYDTK